MTLPSFRDYFRGVHGFDPFPWQERLVDTVLTHGWPKLLDLPTGVGKTSALDIALYTFAAAPTVLPRRVVLVVDRRIVVDQGAELARKILGALTEAKAESTRAFAQALRDSWGALAEDDPFAVAVLRGGMPRDDDWARRPDQPVLGVSTVDQVGSRLFFRGYGVSPRSAPIHAGLMGNDTLILLDEVHLAIPFAETLEAVRSRFRPTVARLPQRLTVVQMSATARSAAQTDAFRLRADDQTHPVLRRRLDAAKRARLVTVKVKGDDESAKRLALAQAAADAALAFREAGTTVVGVVVNRVETARLAARVLSGSIDTILVTGRMRPIDRDRVVSRRLLPSAGNGRDRAHASPLVIVATQCIEAGADLDFDALVSECASLDALRQRFGRLDRSGERAHSEAVILGRSDQIADSADPDPVYGTALRATWHWLTTATEGDGVDFGVAALGPRLESAPDGLVAPAPAAPVLLPAHLDAWAQTSPRPANDPDVALWLHGPQRALPDVQIVWRSDLDDLFAADDPAVHDEEGRSRLEACRPSALESITLPLSAALGWLQGLPTDLSDAETMAAPEDGERDRRTPGMWVFRWTTDRERSGFVRAERGSVHPGDVLIVQCARGGLANDNFDAEAREPVADLGDLAQLRARGVASLRLRPTSVRLWLPAPGDIPLPLEALADESGTEARDRVTAWVNSWPADAPRQGDFSFAGKDEEWRRLRAALSRMKRAPVVVGGHFLASFALPAATREVSEAITEDDDSSFRAGEVSLATHSGDVREFARRFADCLGLAKEVADDVVLAAWLHDVGKADPRFQRWLVGGSEVAHAMLSAPIAKSALASGSRADREQARRRAGYPQGYRHELLSLRLALDTPALVETANDRDLVLHLVASHHGWCRPFAPFDDHPDDLEVEVRHGDVVARGSTRHLQARLDSGVAGRFWALVDRYGWWGLAWLEAILRLADHRASEMRTERP